MKKIVYKEKKECRRKNRTLRNTTGNKEGCRGCAITTTDIKRLGKKIEMNLQKE